MIEQYFHVFTESAWVASIVPFGADPTFFAMHAFGGFPMAPAWVCAVLGACIGQAFNLNIGYGLLFLQKKGSLHTSALWYERVKKWFSIAGIYLLLLSWAPLMNFTSLAAGLLGTRFKVAMPLIFIGQAAYYGCALM